MERRIELHKLIWDLDDCGRYGWDSPLINNLFEDLMIAIKSLQTQFPTLGKAVIRRTLKGYHIVFPESKLPFWLVEYLTQKAPHDYGQLWWSTQHERVTLRISDKPITKTQGKNYNIRLARQIIHDRPQTIRIIYPDGKILYRKEIEEKYGDV